MTGRRQFPRRSKFPQKRAYYSHTRFLHKQWGHILSCQSARHCYDAKYALMHHEVVQEASHLAPWIANWAHPLNSRHGIWRIGRRKFARLLKRLSCFQVSVAVRCPSQKVRLEIRKQGLRRKRSKPPILGINKPASDQ